MKVQSKDSKAIRQLSVIEEQLPFVGRIEDILAAGGIDDHFHIICDENDVVGFFNIDLGFHKKMDNLSEQDLGLRSFFIDKNFQGRGYGLKAVMLFKDYLQENYCSFSAMALTVNCKNIPAIRCYEKGGFEDTDKLYLGGLAGPQHVMRLEY
ncbi:GNAT family N-acetyltransferase [Endozoicomonas sp. OPT23]|uniref:GNAT family N-acetyltransferase n=1 Tax=Endozoicomonas sp. OPT23 TaxID=2072845 RepID=UPI001891E120|nr:GNAT family N-acetyltransferase [Endozoicomonas sp. OPT23]